MSGKVQASARVQITVEFAVGGQVWGEGTTVEQVNKQAREAAFEILRRGLRVHGIGAAAAPAPTSADIVGEPKITAILVERQS